MPPAVGHRLRVRRVPDAGLFPLTGDTLQQRPLDGLLDMAGLARGAPVAGILGAEGRQGGATARTVGGRVAGGLERRQAVGVVPAVGCVTPLVDLGDLAAGLGGRF